MSCLMLLGVTCMGSAAANILQQLILTVAQLPGAQAVTANVLFQMLLAGILRGLYLPYEQLIHLPGVQHMGSQSICKLVQALCDSAASFCSHLTRPTASLPAMLARCAACSKFVTHAKACMLRSLALNFDMFTARPNVSDNTACTS